MTLNPADPRPLYQQLASMLRGQIQSGELAPGDRFPTEGELSDRYDTSRNTVRLALDVLRNEGLIVSQRGRGSFVRTEPPLRYYASLTGSRTKRMEADRRRDTFSQQIEAQGKKARQVSTVETIPANAEIAAHLHLSTDEPVAVRRRVMYADDQPLQLGDSYYPLSIVQSSKIMDPADIIEGTDQVLEDLGHTPTRYEDEITWRMPSAEEATKLHLGPATPVGRLLRTSFDQNDQPIEVYQVILPGDRHVLLYEVDAE
ncbi:GntR family transcriptional regulator [Micromonospora sp. WMMD956]|uniref:GntR family transcriptional regulator n=1 Tax=Micromonospora sp. WMMD956 TaxID=3016108 RepID=UPI002417321D|nr:GntR family transcriptional regulator [Micromonospora sp. WMMD956]MDG4820161.1 GntR family transcriptional regulator [Micromonospora sp. WMMD956]